MTGVFFKGVRAFVTGALILLLIDAVYFGPRYGGYPLYILEGSMARSEAGAVHGTLGATRSALSIYYGDTNGKFPESLDVLWKNKKYLDKPLRHADVYVRGKGVGAAIERAHWHRDTAKIKNFSTSPKDSDDAGGWGYVNDPASPHFGTVFVNCTHPDIRTGFPWNLEGTPEIAAPADPVPAEAPAAASALPAPSQDGFRGVVMEHDGKASVSDADIVFASEDGARTHQAKTDADGRYAIELPPGRYRLTVSHPKYKSYAPGRGFFVVRSGHIGTGNFFLHRIN